MRRVNWILALGFLALAGCAGGDRTTEDRRPIASASAAPAPASPVKLLAIGDWGEDTAAERQVARTMARYVAPDNDLGSFAAVLLCGDNFYFKLNGVDDPRWQTLFEQMYDPAALGMPFYACLGNHDYDGDNRRLELEYSRQHPDSRFKLPADWYRVDLPRDHPLVTILMLDSNKDNLTDEHWNQQIAWLKRELQSARAAWTICVAHHPLFSNGFFWGNGILQNDWGKLFEKYHVDFYLCGHEHDLEHLEIPGWTSSFIIAGGGGAHTHPLARDDRGFSQETYGFVCFELTDDKATVRFLGADDRPLHVFSRTKQGKVQVIYTTPNTPRTNPLKAYLQAQGRPSTTQSATSQPTTQR